MHFDVYFIFLYLMDKVFSTFNATPHADVCLRRLLPLMIGDLIDEEEESMLWENFTTLLTILDFVPSPCTPLLRMQSSR